MTEQLQVTISKNLDASDICNCTEFPHGLVIDLRRESDGSSRPVNELTLKRLQNYFVHFEQMPMDISRHDAKDEDRLYKMLQRGYGDVMILSEDVSAVAAFCQKNEIPFESKALYVVETGKGNLTKSAVWQPGHARKFGTFGG